MLDVIAQHLRDTALELDSVEIVESVEQMADATGRATGAAFVVPFRERAKANSRTTGGHLQEVTVQYLVAFLVRNYADDTGAARVSQFDRFKTDIEAALAGWQPDEANDPFELVTGESTGLGNGVSLYVQTWETSRFLTGGHQ
ncbi:hypothetical protein [uncultured Tateyamaria sp.]|uniref:phage tail terminator protein n=1 Tax=uncultured Tateyamaria sp. TaxID=455651 RepID=UPI0026256795|nr:hypothetical protein [uncultured Tateyamaria sp.]